MRHLRLLVAAALVLLCLVRNAEAGDRVVIESYIGERPTDAATLLGPVYAELGRRGYEYGNALALAAQKELSRDGGALTTTQLVDAQRNVDEAYQRYIDGDYAPAIADARKALAIYASAPGQMARETSLRDLQYKALLVAARSSEAKGSGEDAFGFMAEVIRSYDRSPNVADYDPNIVALYRRVKDELGKQGVGALNVSVDDESAVIFLNERFVGTGAAKVDKLFPGRYRVYVAKGAQPGRIHEIDVAPGGLSTVTVTWQIDGVLRTASDYVGLALPPGTSTEAELAAAVQLGRAVGAKSVAVLSVRALNGRRSVVGYSISIESQNKTFGAVQAEPIAPTSDMLGKLAALLAGDKSVSSEGLITETSTETTAAAVQPSGDSGHLGGRRVTAIVVGVVGLGLIVGGVASELSSRNTYDQSKTEPDPQRQNSLFDSANHKHLLAQGLGIGGAACVVGSLVLWFTGAHHAAERHGVSLTPTATPSGGSLVLSLSF